MQPLCKFYHSSIGKKTIMAITGLIMFGFVVGHMTGNLKIFGGIDATSGHYKIDDYGAFLREMGHQLFGHAGLLWLARIGLLAAVVLHIIAAVQLQALNSAARPIAYKVNKYKSSTIASRYMFWGGLLLAVFIVFHILHFTTGDLNFQGFREGHVYANVYWAFQQWYLTAFYVIAMGALALHLYHGVWSLFQTLGIASPQSNPALKAFACIMSIVTFLGFVAVPISVFTGVLKPPVETPQTQVSQVLSGETHFDGNLKN